jgi:hypothetical protein
VRKEASMPSPTLKFLQAGDFHLEQPLGGVEEVPADLREVFLEAPFLAAEQVFETALVEDVDGLLLTGDLVDLDHAGPRAIVFLLRQFQRLADHGIEIYWAGGPIDPPDAWPPSAPLPPNVHVFPIGRVETFEHRRGDVVIARIQGTSRTAGQPLNDSGFHRDANGLFTIGVAYGTSAAPGTEGDRVHFMALGGQHRRQTVDQSPGIAHYAGTPQGRNPEETGSRGCTLISVDETGHVKARFVATDAIRWISETIEITAGVVEADLLGQIQERVLKMRSNHPDRDLLVSWRITGRGALVNALRPAGYAGELVGRLRKQYAESSPRLWSVDIHCDERIDCPGEWYDQETILGDMLRQFRTLESDEDAPLSLADFLPPRLREGTLASLAEVAVHERSGLLSAASKLGLELIGMEDNSE